MVLFKYIVIIAIASVPFCQSKQTETATNLNSDSNVQKIFDILAAQDEKLNRLHTLMLQNDVIPKCAQFIIREKINLATKCWRGLLTEIKLYDQSVATEIKLLGQLIADAYGGERDRILTIIEIIKNNVERGSELANSAYDTLLNEMDSYGQLYLKGNKADNGVGSGLTDNTYRVLNKIEEAEGASSPIFTQKLPSAVNSILKGKEIFIRNSVTKGYLHASHAYSTYVILGDLNGTDTRYIWKLSPVVDQWEIKNRELFHLTNTFENKVLAVGGRSVMLADATDDTLKSTWAMFYIQLVQGTSGEEVAFQCSYWGIKTLAWNEDDVEDKFLKLEHQENVQPLAVWLLQPVK
ncbi:uncharacterized protein LOC119082724 [Bradysia coprophila]|uniref:uncharacterized protein LOC119082724 n=1 Tax=Bradysia coprophila TaxID=38358 RepID=UPI00187DB01A|nr:uncharacterized protein LOC119082724 [Bradysia coprophila]